jgi:hypothetical protein
MRRQGLETPEDDTMNTIRLHAMPTAPAPRGHPIAPPGHWRGHLEAANDEHANLPAPRPPAPRPARRSRSRAALGTALTAIVALAGAAVLLLGGSGGF